MSFVSNAETVFGDVVDCDVVSFYDFRDDGVWELEIFWFFGRFAGAVAHYGFFLNDEIWLDQMCIKLVEEL